VFSSSVEMNVRKARRKVPPEKKIRVKRSRVERYDCSNEKANLNKEAVNKKK
jgi:hypothetical protein